MSSFQLSNSRCNNDPDDESNPFKLTGCYFGITARFCEPHRRTCTVSPDRCFSQTQMFLPDRRIMTPQPARRASKCRSQAQNAVQCRPQQSDWSDWSTSSGENAELSTETNLSVFTLNEILQGPSQRLFSPVARERQVQPSFARRRQTSS